MHNAIYFSGSHGSGKSTLIKKLAEKDPKLFVVHKKLRIPQVEDSFERQKLRFIRYYHDVIGQQKFSYDNPDKLLLCDRCVSSSQVYAKSLFQLSWLTEEEHEICTSLYENFLDKNIKPKNIIFLNPSLEELKHNIKKRWKEKGKKKWREDNFDYLEKVKNNFEELYSNYKANVLEIDFLNLEKRVSTCYSWIKNL